MKRTLQTVLLTVVLTGLAGPAVAAGGIPGAVAVGDPAAASRAEYGRIDRAGEVDYYSVQPGRTVSVTLEAVIPVRAGSRSFRPSVAVLAPGAPRQSTVPFQVPDGYGVQVIPPDRSSSPKTLFDPNSIERFYRNDSQSVSLPGGRTSYLAVFDPTGGRGDYVLGIASEAYYQNASHTDLLAQGIALKFGAARGRLLPWTDLWGVVLAMLGVAVAGAVAAGVLVPRPRAVRRLRLWRYWTAAGGFAALLTYYAGIRILNRSTGMIAVASFQELLSVVLLLAAIWLAIQPATRPPRRYRIFAALWCTAWLGQAALLAWYVLVTRTT